MSTTGSQETWLLHSLKLLMHGAAFHAGMNLHLRLSSPSDLVALSNMPAVKETVNGPLKTIYYEDSPLMSTYLVPRESKMWNMVSSSSTVKMGEGHETDKNIEIWKVKKLILDAARGNGTSMISLIMPPRNQISRVTKMLGDEYGTASNIKSRVNRQSVLAAITSAQQRSSMHRFDFDALSKIDTSTGRFQGLHGILLEFGYIVWLYTNAQILMDIIVWQMRFM